MIKERISRRNFMGSLVASAVVVHLSGYSWLNLSYSNPVFKRKYDGGYPEGACLLNSN
ncbi:MAG: hypothetical protein ACETWK_08270 [Candidatus Aminicenantaceae bacterium]